MLWNAIGSFFFSWYNLTLKRCITLDFYELLGVDKTSSKADIKKAYHRMVKKYHLDVNYGNGVNDVIRISNIEELKKKYLWRFWWNKT